MIKVFQQQMDKTIHKAIRKQNDPYRVITAFHGLVTVLLTFSICSMAGSVCAATPPAPNKVLSAVGIGTDDVKRLMTGEILSYSITEPTDKALSNGLVMYVKRPQAAWPKRSGVAPSWRKTGTCWPMVKFRQARG